MNEINPYQSPQVDSHAEIEGAATRDLLRLVATRHRDAIVALFVTQAMHVFFMAVLQITYAPDGEGLRTCVALLLWSTTIGSCIAATRLAYALSIVPQGVSPWLIAVGSLLPFAGAIAPTFATARATEFLEQHGLRVGIFGADLSQLEPPVDQATTWDMP